MLDCEFHASKNYVLLLISSPTLFSVSDTIWENKESTPEPDFGFEMDQKRCLWVGHTRIEL